MKNAIQTKLTIYNDTKTAGITAWCYRGTITLPVPIPIPHDPSIEQLHINAAQALVDKFSVEDSTNPSAPEPEYWASPRVAGFLTGNTVAHVFIN